nr:MAG TPA: antitoxin [Caudoviricetes sp.]
MFTGDFKFRNWEKVDIKPRREHTQEGKVWLTKADYGKNKKNIHRVVHINKCLLDEAGFKPGTELILVKSGKFLAFKKVNTEGQFKINSSLTIQNQPLYLELYARGRWEPNEPMEFQAIVNDGMIIFYKTNTI